MPRVSVCLPTYNGERFVAEAIASILAQRFTDFELLVVDDASTDATREIVRAFADPRLRLYQNEQRLGIPGNWNRCLALATGEYVCVFHQDDVMLPENLLRKVRVLGEDLTIGFVHSAAELQVEPDTPPPSPHWMEQATEDFSVDGHAYFRTLLLRGNRICAPTVVARRQILLDLGGFDEDLGFACDYAMWLRVCVEHRVAFVSHPLVRYRWHAGNASHAYRFERGVEELEVAGRRALQHYRQKTGEQEKSTILADALTALTQLRRWAAELERGKMWLDEQRLNWQRMAEERESIIQEQRAWIGELERGKAWLEEQWRNWQRIAEEQRRRAEELEHSEAQLREQRADWQRLAEERARIIQEQQGVIGMLEKSRRWLEEQWQGSSWMRLGVRLGLLRSPVALRSSEEGREERR